MKSLLKKIAIRIIPIGVMAFLIVAAIAYQRGVYDITFIERPTKDTTTAPQVSDTTPIDTAPPVNIGDTTDSTAPDTTVDEPIEIDPQTAMIEEFLGTLDSTDTLLARGFVITDAEYRSASELTLLTADSALRDSFTLRKKTVYEPVRIPDEYDSSYTTVLNPVSVDRPHVEVYMDYLLVDNGRTVDVLAKDGSVLYRSLDIDKYMPAYTRDKSDAALFKTEEPSQSRYGVTITRYYKFDETGKLIESDYNDDADNRGLYANYPTYFGKTDNKYYRYYSNGYFGYGNERGYMNTSYRYKKAYNFSEGYAATVDDAGVLKFVQNWFYPQISNTRIYINSSRRRVYADYMAPDTNGIESLGFYYFDHGLVRIRNREYDAYHFETLNKVDVTIDEEFIIRTDGSRFPVPTDYTVVAYSNGIMLLEKDGYYGFMDYTGKWIAHPIYTDAMPFNEGLAVVELDGVCGMIDTSGEFVIPLAFDYISGVSGGIISAYEESIGWQLFNKVQ